MTRDPVVREASIRRMRLRNIIELDYLNSVGLKDTNKSLPFLDDLGLNSRWIQASVLLECVRTRRLQVVAEVAWPNHQDTAGEAGIRQTKHGESLPRIDYQWKRISEGRQTTT